jgi:hypothetical protein
MHTHINTYQAAEERGNELMGVLMSVATPPMFEDSVPGGGTSSHAVSSEPQLLQDMQRRSRLDVEVVGALRKVRE